MPKRRKPPPLEWTEVRDNDGSVTGHYRIEGDMMYVRYPGGGIKPVRIGPRAGLLSLVRIVLREPPP